MATKVRGGETSVEGAAERVLYSWHLQTARTLVPPRAAVGGRVVLDEHRLMDDRRTRYALSAVAGSAMCISAIFEEGEMKRKSLAKGSCESGYV